MYIVTDNARNIVSAIDHSKANGLTCFAHNLQLCIKDAKCCNAGMLTKAKAIVRHFKHSPQDTAKLIAKQNEMGMEPKKLIQDCETRWNSEYLMLRRLIELKGPLSLMLLDISKIDNLTNSEWQAAENYVVILEPLATATDDVSGNRLPTRSMIIPILHEVQAHLQRFVASHPGETGITFAKLLQKSFQTRFPLYTNNNPVDVICTLVDPRFKDVYIPENEKKKTEQDLKREVQKNNRNADEAESNIMETIGNEESTSNRPKQRWFALQSLTETRDVNEANSKTRQVDSEVEHYLSEPLVPTNVNPLVWWKENIGRFPTMRKTVKQCLGIPATEVASERVFSSAGNIITNRRERLATQHVEQLVFLNQNIKRKEVFQV